MNEQELKARVKVLVMGSTYHWRDANDRALCNPKEEGVLTPLPEIPPLTFVCGACARTVETMAQGW